MHFLERESQWSTTQKRAPTERLATVFLSMTGKRAAAAVVVDEAVPVVVDAVAPAAAVVVPVAVAAVPAAVAVIDVTVLAAATATASSTS